MKRCFPVLIIAAVALISVVGGMMLYRARRLPVSPTARNATGSYVGADDAIHARGPSNASVTLEEFADFQCHACGVLAGAMEQVRREYQQQVRIIFRHFPLEGHAHAHEAAAAAEAAAVQGRFWDMHDLLFREQERWSKAADVRVVFEDYAKTLGLNVDAFKSDMESEEAKARITIDQEQGRRSGVTSTPTVFINKRALPARALNAPGLRNAVAAETNAQPAR
jgi:protein-disulfide isomerase